MWKSVPEWEGWYEVSSRGEVRSVNRTILFSDGRVRAYTGKKLAQYTDRNGYRKVTLKKNGTDFRVHVHFLVASAFLGPRPKGWVVRHFDGDNTNNKKGNLKYGTHAENHADTLRHGRRPRGVGVYNAVLNEDLVREIRAARGTVAELAEHFGISRTALWNVQNRKRWGWLP